MPYDLAIPLPMDLPKKIKALCKILYRSVYRSFIYNGPKLETSILHLVNKQVHSYNEYSSAIKKNEPLLYATTWRSLKSTVLSKRSQIQRHMLHHSTDINFWKTQNYRNRNQISGCQRLGGGIGMIPKGCEGTFWW